jgi:hypothetical protein
VEISAALAGNLTILSEALNGADISLTLSALAAHAKLAVSSYLGMSATATLDGRRIDLVAMEGVTARDHVLASLLLPLTSTAPDGGTESLTSLVLYAGNPGAFMDLAADLAWVTGREPDEFVLDQHGAVPEATEPSILRAVSVINQAIGALIAHGYPPERAHQELDARSERAGVDRAVGARRLLDGLIEPRA